jgi:hypothetical protein
MDRHVAAVTLLESFDLGKNTAKDAGIEIKVFGKGTAHKRGPQIGTIRIGQGSFSWWAKSAKVKTKTGTRSATVRLGWNEFAARMEVLATERRKSSKKTKKTAVKSTKALHDYAVASVSKALLS